jgi:hypothetical protein
MNASSAGSNLYFDPRTTRRFDHDMDAAVLSKSRQPGEIRHPS